MSSLDNREKLQLLRIARRALVAAVERIQDFRASESELIAGVCAGAFVTLHRGRNLRGCIGQLGTAQPTADVVAYAARAAALEDPRFEPVRPNELAEIEIELSILSTPSAISAHEIEAGKHGLIVSRGRARGLLLPQVAVEHRWDAGRLLEETCVKAGLERDAWKHSQTAIFAFTAEVFSESEFRGETKPETPNSRPSGYSSST